jgi:hypothetical protein
MVGCNPANTPPEISDIGTATHSSLISASRRSPPYVPPDPFALGRETNPRSPKARKLRGGNEFEFELELPGPLFAPILVGCGMPIPEGTLKISASLRILTAVRSRSDAFPAVFGSGRDCDTNVAVGGVVAEVDPGTLEEPSDPEGVEPEVDAKLELEPGPTNRDEVGRRTGSRR